MVNIATYITVILKKFESTCILHYEVMILFYTLYNQTLLQEDLKKTRKILEDWNIDFLAAVTQQTPPPPRTSPKTKPKTYCKEGVDITMGGGGGVCSAFSR